MVWTPDCACGKLVSVLLDLPGVCHVFTPQDCEHGSNKSTPCRIAHCSSCGSAAEHSSSATAEGAAVEASSRTQPGGCVGTHSPGVPWRCLRQRSAAWPLRSWHSMPLSTEAAEQQSRCHLSFPPHQQRASKPVPFFINVSEELKCVTVAARGSCLKALGIRALKG